MSTSRHPVALRLERQVGRGTRLLGTVMALPLVDGIFPALVLAGALTAAGGSALSITGVLEVGLLVFGGSATLAVVLAEMEGSRRQRAAGVLAVGALVVPLAALEAALAPTLEQLLAMAVFERFAALVIFAIAAKTASSTVGEWIPRPGAIIGLGLVASLDVSGVELVVDPNPTLVGAAAAAAGVGVLFALVVALAGPTLRGLVDLDRFRFGSAVALGILPLTLLGVIPSDRPLALAVLGVTCLLSLDPDSEEEATDAAPDRGPDPDLDSDPRTDSGSESVPGSPAGADPAESETGAGPEPEPAVPDPDPEPEPEPTPAPGTASAAGVCGAEPPTPEAVDESGTLADGDEDGETGRDPERVPWL
jgi:hypothetical protein